jgi:hypothetical protein
VYCHALPKNCAIIFAFSFVFKLLVLKDITYLFSPRTNKSSNIGIFTMNPKLTPEISCTKFQFGTWVQLCGRELALRSWGTPPALQKQ